MADITIGGWDTAYAVRLSRLNAVIAAQAAAGKLAFKQVQATAAFGSYAAPVIGLELVQDGDGSGDHVALRLLLGAGTITTDKPAPVPPLAVVGMANLAQIEDASFTHIQIKPADAFARARLDGVTLGMIQNSIILEAVSKAVAANAASLEIVLATIDKSAPQLRNTPWLSPTAVRHSLSPIVLQADGTPDPVAARNRVFAVLAMTAPFVNGNPTPPVAFDDAMMAADDDCAFVLSRAKFTRNVLFPGVANGLFSPSKPFTADELHSCEAQHLVVDERLGSVRMRSGSGSIAMKTMTVDVSPLYGLFAAAVGAPVLWFPTLAALGITLLTQLIEHQSPNLLLPVTVQLDDFTFERNGDLFHVTAKASCALNLGAVNLVNIRVTTQADYQLLLQEDGAFAFRQQGTPFTSSPDVTAPEWLTKLGDIGTVVSILLGAVLTVVTEGTAAVVIGIAAALISGAINVVPELVAQGLASGTQVAIPAHIQAFVSNAVAPVSWIGGGTLAKPKLVIGSDVLVKGGLSGA